MPDIPDHQNQAVDSTADGAQAITIATAQGQSTRLRGGQLWDESTRPTAPPAPAGYAYSRRGRLIGNHLREVHDHLRAELSQIRELLRQVKLGGLPAGRARELINEMTIRQNNWTLGAYCASYCSVVAAHHGLEDQAIFPHLRQADPALGPVTEPLSRYGFYAGQL
jgi:hypothetical protein